MSSGTVKTIAFLNHSYPKPETTVWVFQDEASYEESLQDLKKSNHIEILQSGPSFVMSKKAA